MDSNQKASLGCGTLILIALLIMIFGNLGSDDLRTQIGVLERQIQDLEATIMRLESKIDQQSQQLQELRPAADQEQVGPDR